MNIILYYRTDCLYSIELIYKLTNEMKKNISFICLDSIEYNYEKKNRYVYNEYNNKIIDISPNIQYTPTLIVDNKHQYEGLNEIYNVLTYDLFIKQSKILSNNDLKV